MADEVKLSQLRNVMSEFFTQYNANIGRTDDRIVQINFKVMKRMAEKDILINGIIKKRKDQIKPFCKPSTTSDVRGFRVVNIKTNKMDKRSDELMKFFMDTGFGYDPDREDDMADVVDMLLYDLMVYDQIAVEIRRTKGGDVFDFWVVDGTTIKRNKDRNSKYRFVQEVEDKGAIFATGGNRIVAKYTNEDLIFDYMNKRSTMLHRGYGYSPIEQAVDIITTFLFGMGYNRDQFLKDKIPRGFIKVMGDVKPTTIASIQRYWYQQMMGYGAKWKIPIIPSGKNGVGMDFQRLNDSNKDMEYSKLMQLVMALKAGVYGIDLLELGLKFERTQQVIGESGESRLQHSKDGGLSSNLIFMETLFNKILRKVDENYRFEFMGVKDDDKKKKEEIKEVRLRTDTSIDDLREEDGKEPYDEEWSRIPLNEKVVQMITASKQAEQFGGGFGGEEAEEPEVPEDRKRARGKTGEEEEGEGEEAQKSEGELIVI